MEKTYQLLEIKIQINDHDMYLETLVLFFHDVVYDIYKDMVYVEEYEIYKTIYHMIR
jgi:hypothetical protein